jgi:integrase/recombinase XerD
MIYITHPRTHRNTTTHTGDENDHHRRSSAITTRTSSHTVSAERRHTFVTTMLDAGVDLRDVQIAARHADPRTTMRYDNSRELHRMGENPQVA